MPIFSTKNQVQGLILVKHILYHCTVYPILYIHAYKVMYICTYIVYIYTYCYISIPLCFNEHLIERSISYFSIFEPNSEEPKCTLIFSSYLCYKLRILNDFQFISIIIITCPQNSQYLLSEINIYTFKIYEHLEKLIQT